MLALAKAGLAIVAGGVLFGILLGHAADPRIKPPPEPIWRTARQDHAAFHATAPVQQEEFLIPFGGFAAEPAAPYAPDAMAADGRPQPGRLELSPRKPSNAATAAGRAARDARQAADTLSVARLEPVPGNP